jgi:hypothetical protein
MNSTRYKKSFRTLILYIVFVVACGSMEMSGAAVEHIKIICTAAILPQDYNRRKQEYINGINQIKKFGFMPYIVESCQLGPTFLEGLSDRVWYSHTNDYTIKNKGVNEAKSLLNFFEHNCQLFNDEDLIVKVTGRYYLINDFFLQSVVQRSEYDAFVKDVAKLYGHNWLDIFTACFAMKYKYLIEFLRQLNFEEMEKKSLCIEWKLGDYIASKKEMKVCMLDELNLRYRISYEGIDKYI